MTLNKMTRLCCGNNCVVHRIFNRLIGHMTFVKNKCLQCTRTAIKLYFTYDTYMLFATVIINEMIINHVL